MYHNNKKNKLRGDHNTLAKLGEYQNNSLILPSNKYAKWKIYNDINVRIPNHPNQLLKMDFHNWTIPDVSIDLVNCQNINQNTLNYWINDKYKKIFDIITSDDIDDIVDHINYSHSKNENWKIHDTSNVYWHLYDDMVSFGVSLAFMMWCLLMELIRRLLAQTKIHAHAAVA